MKAIDNFIEELSKLDCGSNSCEFAKNKSGQRSNSGCQCLGGYRDRVKIPVVQLWRTLK